MDRGLSWKAVPIPIKQWWQPITENPPQMFVNYFLTHEDKREQTKESASPAVIYSPIWAHLGTCRQTDNHFALITTRTSRQWVFRVAVSQNVAQLPQLSKVLEFGVFFLDATFCLGENQHLLSERTWHLTHAQKSTKIRKIWNRSCPWYCRVAAGEMCLQHIF